MRNRSGKWLQKAVSWYLNVVPLSREHRDTHTDISQCLDYAPAICTSITLAKGHIRQWFINISHGIRNGSIITAITNKGRFVYEL